MKEFLIKALNYHYSVFLAKPKHRKRLNDFLFFFLWRAAFFFGSLLPVKKSLIVFCDRSSESLPEDFSSLYEKAKENGFECRLLLKHGKKSSCIYKNELRKIRDDLQFMRYYARAKTVFLNDYYLPAYSAEPRSGTNLIQLWHACGAFKKWGYSTADSSWGMTGDELKRYNVHRTYTAVSVSAEATVPKYAEAFGISESVIKPLGTPRTDVLFEDGCAEKQRAAILKKYPEIGNRKIILYAPTIRGNSLRESVAENALDILKMKEALGEDYALLLRLHPHAAKSFQLSKEEEAQLSSFLFDGSNGISSAEALAAADILVTDYSSVIFEYSLFERPMIFYAYDLEEYESGRSFYYNYRSFVPGDICKTADELIGCVRANETDFDESKVRQFKEKFMSACDGESTDRIYKEYIERE